MFLLNSSLPNDEENYVMDGYGLDVPRLPDVARISAAFQTTLRMLTIAYKMTKAVISSQMKLFMLMSGTRLLVFAAVSQQNAEAALVSWRQT